MAKKSMFSGSGKAGEALKAKQQEKAANAPQHQPKIRAMVWYKEEHWDKLLTLFVDTDQLPRTFADWSVRAEEKKNEVEALGDQVIKVFIDPETFPAWCESKDLPMNSEARAQLAIEVAQAQSFSM